MPTALAKRIENNVAFVRKMFADCADLTVTPWQFGPKMNHVAVSIFFETLVPANRKNVFRQTLQDLVPHPLGPGAGVTADMLRSYLLRHIATEEPYFLIDNADDLVKCLLKGCIVVLVDGFERGIVYRTGGIVFQSAGESAARSDGQSPGNDAVADLRQNIGMIRRKLQSPNFKLLLHTGGGESGRTTLAYGYLEGTVDPEVLAEFKRRFGTLSGWDVLDAASLEALINDNKWTPFPQVRYTSRTDAAAASLLKGKIIVLADGWVGILVCPVTFFEQLDAGSARHRSAFQASLIRWLRLTAMLIALLLPGLYIAAVSLHPEWIPSALALAIFNASEGLPLPAAVEAIIMALVFELLREAGARIPHTAGPAVAITAGLVLGTAAIASGAASPATVVVMALAGAAAFSLPRHLSAAFRLLQLPVIAMAAWLGGFGLIACCMLLWIHLAGITSLGVPYMTPLAPWKPGSLSAAARRRPPRSQVNDPRMPAEAKPQP